MGGNYDLTGRRIGKLVVINREAGSRWRLRCDCGNEVIRDSSNISRNPKFAKKSSCGCDLRVDLTAKRFGRLTVVSFFKNDRHRHSLWNCLCDCGKYCVTGTPTLQNGKSKSCGCLLGEYLKGKAEEAKQYVPLVEGEVYASISKTAKKVRTVLSQTSKNKKRYDRYHTDEQYRQKMIARAVKAQRENRVRNLLRSAKARSKTRGIPFNLTEADIIIPEYCPVLGIKLDRGNNYQKDNSPSMDKIIPSKGYIKGNVRVISWRANRFKSDANAEELGLVLEYMKSANPMEYCLSPQQNCAALDYEEF